MKVESRRGYRPCKVFEIDGSLLGYIGLDIDLSAEVLQSCKAF